jgi:hypothetical protein
MKPSTARTLLVLAAITLGGAAAVLIGRGTGADWRMLITGAAALLIVVLTAGWTLLKRVGNDSDGVIRDASELSTLAFPPSSLRK